MAARSVTRKIGSSDTNNWVGRGEKSGREKRGKEKRGEKKGRREKGKERKERKKEKRKRKGKETGRKRETERGGKWSNKALRERKLNYF